MKVDVKRAALLADVSPSLIYSWCREQRLPCYRLGREGRRGSIRIDTADLENFLKQLRRESHPLMVGA